MTRVLVQRGSSGSSSNTSHSSSLFGSSSSSETEPQINNNNLAPLVIIDEEITDEKQANVVEEAECSKAKNVAVYSDEPVDKEDDEELVVTENVHVESKGVDCESAVSGGSNPDSPPIPIPPSKPSSTLNRVITDWSWEVLVLYELDQREEVLGLALLFPLGVHLLDHILLLQNHTVRMKDIIVLMSMCHAMCPLILALAWKENTSSKMRFENQKALKSGGCWRMEIVFFGLLQIKYMGTQRHMTWLDRCAWITWNKRGTTFHSS